MKIEVDVHLNYHVPVPCWVLVQLEAAPLPSQNVLRQSLVVANQSEVDRVPADDAVGNRFWVKAEGDLVCSYQAALEVTRTSSDIRTMAASPLQQLPAEAIKYLLPSRYCPLEPFDAFLDEQFAAFPAAGA